MSQIHVPTNLLGGVLNFVELSSMTTKVALDEIGVSRQSREKAAGIAGPLLDHLVAKGVIDAGQKQAAAAMLASHSETLTLLKAAADKIAELKGELAGRVGEPGRAVDDHTKSAGDRYDSLNSTVVGAQTSFVRESDRPLLALIGK